MDSRRQFLASSAATGSLFLAGCFGGIGGSTNDGETTSQAIDTTMDTWDGEYSWDGDSQLDSFVDTDGTNFVVDGESIYFVGTNNFWLTDPGTGTAPRIDHRMAQYEKLGFNMVRTWATCEGREGMCEQPEPGEYNEAAFVRLDYLIAKASEHGIRLVLTLNNYWDHYGGMPQYMEWVGGGETDEFYDNETAQQLYRDYVEYVLTRENTFTGREYGEEPAIAIWELSNEPRAKQREDNVEALHQWLKDSAELVHEHTDNQLVSTGMEGFMDREDGEKWWENGSQGTAYVQNHQIDAIDACTFHMYPDHWGKSAEWATGWLEEHVEAGHEEVGTPVYCGEFGWKADRSGGTSELERRNEVLGTWYELFDESDITGALIWQVLGESMAPGKTTIHMSTGSTMGIIEEYVEATREKSEAEW
jgi:mannan endo-1,4-beta-mannosidase